MIYEFMFTLFKDEDVFSPEYTPDVFLYQEAQMNSLQFCLKPAIRNQKPINAFLVGKPATGKTTALRIAFSQLEESSNAICVHINCSNTTTFRILAEIHRKVVGYLPPETGVPIAKVQDTVFKKIIKEKLPLLVALDDVIDIKGIEEAMYIILRAHESYPQAKTGVILASVKNELHGLDDRIKSSFNPEIISFLPYSEDQIIDILKKRADFGLYPNVAAQDIIRNIAENSADLRIAIETLRASVIKAESGGRKCIKLGDIKLAAKTEDKVSDEKCIVLEAVKKKNPIDTGSLYEAIRSKLSYSKFYRILKSLESEDMIKIKEIQKGRGKSRLIELK